MPKDNDSMGAWDFMQKLQSNPEWMAAHKARKAKHKSFDDMLARNEAPILKDIFKAGLKIDSVWDLVNTRYNYPEAIPVLLQHLHAGYHHRIREGMIRALNTPVARGLASKVILADLKKEKDKNFRFVLANSMYYLALPEQRDEIEALLESSEFQDVHKLLEEVLKNLKN